MAGEYDMNRMQEDAIRRAREMQSRARFPREEARAAPVPRPGRPLSGTSPSAGPPAESGESRRPSSQPARPERNRQEQEPEEPQKSGPPAPPEPAEAATEPTQPGGILESLLKDKERTIILALLILLSSEGNNHELMFALMFLLM